MATNALRGNARTTWLNRLDGQTISMLNRSRKFICINRNLADRLRWNSICCLSTAPAQNASISAQIFSHKRSAKLALLGITNRELRVRRKQEGRVLLVREIVTNVIHARFFIRAQKCTEGIARFNALAQQKGAGVKAHHSRALVVNDTAAQQPALTTLHRKRVSIPTRTSRNHINVSNRCNLALALTRDIRDTHIAIVMRGLIAKFLRNRERTVERRTRACTKRCARLVGTFNCHRRHSYQCSNVLQHVIPNLVDIGVNTSFQILIHYKLQSAHKLPK